MVIIILNLNLLVKTIKNLKEENSTIKINSANKEIPICNPYDLQGNLQYAVWLEANQQFENISLIKPSYQPVGLAEDLEGNIWVSEFTTHRLHKIVLDQETNTVKSFEPVVITGGDFSYPVGICFDNEGNAYITDSEHN